MPVYFRKRSVVLPTSADRKWYNLETGRMVKNPQSHLYFLTEPAVAGTAPVLEEFFRENDLKGFSLDGLVAGLLPPLPEPLRKPLPPLPIRLTATVRGYTFHFDAASLPSAVQAAKNSKLERKVSKVETLLAKLHLLPKEDGIKETVEDPLTIRDFSKILEGLRITGKVVYIVDGDTFDVEITIPISHLSPGAAGFFPMKVRIRPLEFDAAEKNTVAGLAAGLLLANRLEQDNFFLKLNFEGSDLHGRALAHCLTLDGQRYSEYMVRLDTPFGKIALPYNGGTKSKTFVAMKDRTTEEAHQVKQLYGHLLTEKIRQILNPEIVSWVG